MAVAKHECPRCQQRFFFLDSLNRHMEKHEKPKKKLRRVGSYKGQRVNKRTARDKVEFFLISVEREHMQEQRGRQALWASVIRKVWSDAFYSVKLASSHPSTAYVRTTKKEARNFLLGDFEWKRARIEYCDYAGINPDWLEQQARKAMEAA